MSEQLPASKVLENEVQRQYDESYEYRSYYPRDWGRGCFIHEEFLPKCVYILQDWHVAKLGEIYIGFLCVNTAPY